MPSFSYSIIKLVLKLKGTKKIFSQDPILYKNLRKDDIISPSKLLLRGNRFTSFKVEKSTITEIIPKDNTSPNTLIFYCPGGAFVSGPSDLAWNSISYLTKKTGAKAWVINYPKAPENQIEEISDNIYKIYSKAILSYKPSNIILLGDSAGGCLILTLAQKLVEKNLPSPGKLIAITPLVDASMSNPEIEKIAHLDPILGKVGVLSAKKMCAGNLNLKNPIISPLYGSFESFPPTHIFVAEHDILSPDINLAIEKMKTAKISLEVTPGKSMPHLWPLLPVMKEARTALAQIAASINKSIS
jgi:acetyl esterase/lipase